MASRNLGSWTGRRLCRQVVVHCELRGAFVNTYQPSLPNGPNTYLLYNTIQYNTIQYNTIQYNTQQLRLVPWYINRRVPMSWCEAHTAMLDVNGLLSWSSSRSLSSLRIAQASIQNRGYRLGIGQLINTQVIATYLGRYVAPQISRQVEGVHGKQRPSSKSIYTHTYPSQFVDEQASSHTPKQEPKYLGRQVGGCMCASARRHMSCQCEIPIYILYLHLFHCCARKFGPRYCICALCQPFSTDMPAGVKNCRSLSSE